MNSSINSHILLQIKDAIFCTAGNQTQQFFLFWSRVDGSAKDRSDYDIGCIWDTQLDPIIHGNLEDAFDSIPALIDFTDFTQVDNDFKDIAMKNIIWLKK